MPDSTSGYGIPKPLGGDPVGDGDDTFRDAMDLLDLYMGEWGTYTFSSPVADTNMAQRINYGRDYSPYTPRVFAMNDSATAAATALHIWISGEDSTGFTLNIRSSNTSAKSVRWHARRVSDL